MKANQRKIYNRLKKALAIGREKGYKSTTGAIYAESEKHKYACAFGAMAIGLGIEDVPTLKDTNSCMEAVADKLQIDYGCVNSIYGPIYVGNDNAFNKPGYERDESALSNLERYLNDHPEVC